MNDSFFIEHDRGKWEISSKEDFLTLLASDEFYDFTQRLHFDQEMQNELLIQISEVGKSLERKQ